MKGSIFGIHLAHVFAWLIMPNLTVLSTANGANLSSKDSARLHTTTLMAGFGAHAIKGSLEASYEKYLPSLECGILFEKKRSRALSFHISAGSLISDKYNLTLPERYANLQPARYVRTTYFSLYASQHIHLFRYHSLVIGASVGFGIFRYNTFDNQGRSLRDNFRSRAPGENFTPTALMLPIHLNVRYRFANDVGLSFQAGWLNTFNKGLDNMNILAGSDRNDNVAGFKCSILLPLKSIKH